MTVEREETVEAVASIFTPRLELVAMRPECLRSELERDGRLGERLGCEVTGEWPPEVWEPHVWELLLGHFAERPEEIAWHRYVVLREPRVLVGTVNAFRWPERTEEAEIGYALAPEFWRRGLASEAAEAMVAWVTGTRQVSRLCAHTFPEIVASVRVLERCGFVLEGPGAEEGTVRYRRETTEEPIRLKT
ncbi:MAG TPA: GNAT family N-acetyltransferase [Acidobacteriaceae bacterium]|nr:GNAT family N-acetyltransferase [Acidobacteriaceae bacterium]